MNNEKVEIGKIVGPLVAILVIGSLFVLTFSSVLKFVASPEKEDLKPVVEEIIKEKRIVLSKPKCDRSAEGLEALKGREQYLRLVSKTSSFGKSGKFTSDIEPTVLISGNDDIACGYLFVRVSKGGKPMDKRFESLYVNPHGFGGHVLWNKGIVLSENTGATEAIIPLDSVSYLPGLPYNPDATDFRIADWSNLLNVNSHVQFGIGLSTQDSNGLIEEIGIAYRCWNPETGEESNNCQLSLQQ